MFLLELGIKFRVLIGISAMMLLFASFLVAVINNQRKKLQHQKDLQRLQEVQQNQLIEAAVRSEEQERHRIAEELHDEVGALLSSCKLHLQGIRIDMPDRDRQLFDKSNELLDEGIRKVRGISHNLHSNILKQFGLNEAIRHFVSQLTKGTLIECSVNLDDRYPSEFDENNISIYRLVQELLNNILKHAHATSIHINSILDEGRLHLTMEHNGRGLRQDEFERLRYEKDGLGLKNIQNRIILLKGSLHFSEEPNGYRIAIEIPTA